MFVQAVDPPIRPDGTCAECGKPRRFEGVKPLYRRAAETDPFCSAPCARAFHGCALPESERVGRERKQWRHGTEYGYVKHKCRCAECRRAANAARAARRP